MNVFHRWLCDIYLDGQPWNCKTLNHLLCRCTIYLYHVLLCVDIGKQIGRTKGHKHIGQVIGLKTFREKLSPKLVYVLLMFLCKFTDMLLQRMWLSWRAVWHVKSAVQMSLCWQNWSLVGLWKSVQQSNLCPCFHALCGKKKSKLSPSFPKSLQVHSPNSVRLHAELAKSKLNAR